MHELAQVLSLAGLALGTLAYALLVRRRELVRRERAASAITGLHGLVRVLVADQVEGMYAAE